MSSAAVTTISRLTANVSIHQMRQDTSPAFYVLNKGMDRVGQISKIVITHTSPSGEQFSIEVPHTWIPIDLALYVSKAELLDNRHLMRTLQTGVLQLVLTKEAEALLETTEAKEELERLRKARQVDVKPTTGDLVMSTFGDQQQAAQQFDSPAAAGSLDPATANVAPSVVEIMEGEHTDTERANLLRSITPLLAKPETANYIRSKTTSAEILRLLA